MRLMDCEVDYVVYGEVNVVVEVMTMEEKYNLFENCVERLKKYSRDIKDLIPAEIQEGADLINYRVFGKYKVKETFAGEDSLTDLLTQYVERSVSMSF